MKRRIIAGAAILSLATASLAQAQSPDSMSRATLVDLIHRAASEIDKEIIFDERLNSIPMNSTEADDADYESLLGLLRNAGYAATEVDDQILIIPEGAARSTGTKVVNEDDRRISDHEVVTRILAVPEATITAPDGSETFLAAAQLVPILRPMMAEAV